MRTRVRPGCRRSVRGIIRTVFGSKIRVVTRRNKLIAPLDDVIDIGSLAMYSSGRCVFFRKIAGGTNLPDAVAKLTSAASAKRSFQRIYAFGSHLLSSVSSCSRPPGGCAMQSMSVSSSQTVVASSDEHSGITHWRLLVRTRGSECHKPPQPPLFRGIKGNHGHGNAKNFWMVSLPSLPSKRQCSSTVKPSTKTPAPAIMPSTPTWLLLLRRQPAVQGQAEDSNADAEKIPPRISRGLNGHIVVAALFPQKVNANRARCAGLNCLNAVQSLKELSMIVDTLHAPLLPQEAKAAPVIIQDDWMGSDLNIPAPPGRRSKRQSLSRPNAKV